MPRKVFGGLLQANNKKQERSSRIIEEDVLDIIGQEIEKHGRVQITGK